MKYTTTLQSYDTDVYTKTFIAGSVSLTITFNWPRSIQDLYDNLVANNKAYANNNPLTDAKGSIIRNYDYISYVVAQDSSTYWPVHNTEDWFESRLEEAQAIAGVRDQLIEMLAWDLFIEDGDVTYTTTIRTGGSLISDDKRWVLTFTSAKEGDIGRDDLYLVTVELEVA